MHGDGLDVPLEDRELADEILLLCELIVAAHEADGRLDQSAIDGVLGLD